MRYVIAGLTAITIGLSSAVFATAKEVPPPKTPTKTEQPSTKEPVPETPAPELPQAPVIEEPVITTLPTTQPIYIQLPAPLVRKPTFVSCRTLRQVKAGPKTVRHYERFYGYKCPKLKKKVIKRRSVWGYNPKPAVAG